MKRSLALAASWLVAVLPVHADTITRAQIAVKAVDPADVRVTSALTVRVEGSTSRKSLDLFLSRDVEVLGAEAGGQAAGVSAEDVPETLLRRWSVSLPKAIGSGETGVVTLEAKLGSAGPDGGSLLPGSGWFPQLAPGTDELPAHSTTFELPAGQVGVAAGGGSGNGSWTATAGARPFAVWGEYEQSRTAGEPAIDVWRRPGRSGAVPRIDRIERLVKIVATGMSAEGEVPAWKLIDVGQETIAGGQGTVFWDEELAASADGATATLVDRELGGAIATTFWTEHFRTVGSHAAWLSRSIAAYLGDVACIALDDSDFREATEAAVISPRRAAFLEGIAGDRPLEGVVPVSADGPRCLATRGALSAHALAERTGSRTRWLVCLGDFRSKHAGASIDLETFREFVGRTFTTHHVSVWPMLDSLELPRFAISAHGPAKKGTGKKRYRVEVTNHGEAEGSVEVLTFSAAGHRLRGTLMTIRPSEKKAVMFDQPDHIARIQIDPRGLAMQSALEDQVVELTPSVAVSADEYVPAFSFYTQGHTGHAVENFSLELDGVSITEFDGFVAYYSTHHGPSGAALIGKGNVTIAPTGPFAAGFEKTTGQSSLTFYDARNMWIRFPLAAWEKIEPQLGDEGAEDEQAILRTRERIRSNMFRSYFTTEHRAQVPPPGAALLIFVAESEEWRGIVRRPLPNGRVEMRLWDHLRKDTLWEETH